MFGCVCCVSIIMQQLLHQGFVTKSTTMVWLCCSCKECTGLLRYVEISSAHVRVLVKPVGCQHLYRRIAYVPAACMLRSVCYSHSCCRLRSWVVCIHEAAGTSIVPCSAACGCFEQNTKWRAGATYPAYLCRCAGLALRFLRLHWYARQWHTVRACRSETASGCTMREAGREALHAIPVLHVSTPVPLLFTLCTVCTTCCMLAWQKMGCCTMVHRRCSTARPRAAAAVSTVGVMWHVRSGCSSGPAASLFGSHLG
jgi:hypothetical protein